MFAKLFEIPGFNIYLMIAFILGATAMHLLVTRGKPREGLLGTITMFTIGISGWFAISSAIFGHMLYADVIAESIGWLPGSGFQTELAFALIGIGALGALGFWRWDFWLPYVITRSVITFGAGLTHLNDLLQHGNLSPNNVGIVLIWDFLFPIILIGLYTMYRRSKSPQVAVSSPALSHQANAS